MKFIVIGMVLLGLGLGFVIFRGTSDSSEKQPTSIEMAIDQLAQNQAVIIDVRTEEEWNESHVSGATLWGLAEKLEMGKMPDIAKDQEIFVYCRSGNRSGQAIKLMEEAGFTNLINIGGLNDWIAAGGPVTAGG